MAMVFPTSPTVGQVFTSGGRSWVWNGSAWDSPAGQPFLVPGMTHLKTISFSGVSGFAPGAGTFSSLYDDYKIIIELTASTGANLTFRLQSGNVDNNTANYFSANQSIGTSGNTVTWIAGEAQTIGSLLRITSAGNLAGLEIDVISPAIPSQTTIFGSGFATDATLFAQWRLGAKHLQTLAFDNIAFYPSAGTATGRLSVYGMRK
jgi:hypothetical protein